MSRANLRFYRTKPNPRVPSDGSARPQTDMLKILDLYAQGRLKLDELVSSTISLDQINEGLDLLRSGTVARTLVLMRGEEEDV